MKRASGKSNLSIVKDYLEGNRPFIQVSMSGVEELAKRKEGEEWEDSAGKKWKKINGRKVYQPKQSTIVNKEECNICKCDVRFGSRYDKQIWPKSGKCYDCFIEFETLLKYKGLYDSYIKKRDFKNLRGTLLDFKAKLEETIKWCNSDSARKIETLNDTGPLSVELTIEHDNTDRVDVIKRDAEKDLQLVHDRLKDIEIELPTLSTNDAAIKTIEKQLQKKYKKGRDGSFTTIEVLNK